ncbi:toll/interleukin-1 receptor domain-containing protein [Burkholderia anthinoferrum]|uniref:Toll/interleukin-1 receptor domain-containing protein n=1 Tax=Burkholderia anthinoferrum TaxID=3090833 RepID=A0ABU5WU17_9BURK|nr:toll/interleukin-1 receptor domain-containing protein [Burkholderia anthinoferrum]MEB2535841.1 toll/interleukin-1 receptor domain-containing protein [Burkholderia anthinoferrum]MEB2561969.1 toll/interleukin-1 receptor domain-containing protein [Burkholderia anthinoferrum]MEB2582270.1 toll/interleukin-1 receptor domain-containing protein [Burkholderia anthinoferrum]
MAPGQKPLIFISHIHEEGALAKLFKDAIETEFGGFVEVFVSSDHGGIAQGAGIKAGAHFVEAVEAALVNCVAAFYLISPKSVRRPWVNFELGAVWCRGAVQKAAGGDRVMALPICHSGVVPSGLPAPLNALNAITATRALDLEFAFMSLQRILGVSGSPLRTDFAKFAANAKRLEDLYTVGEVLARNLHATLMIREDVVRLIDQCRSETQRGTKVFTINVARVKQATADAWSESVREQLLDKVSLKIEHGALAFGESGVHNICDIVLTLDPNLIAEHADTILSLYK